MNKSAVHISILALLLCTLLSSCGWQLRGTAMIPEGLKTLHVSAKNEQSLLVKDMQRALKSAGVATPVNAIDAEYALIILQERSHVRTATVNANARVSEQQLTEEAQFLILNREGKTLLPRSTASVERVFEYNENNVLATDDEKQLIRAEMRLELAGQILNRLRQLRDLNDAPSP